MNPIFASLLALGLLQAQTAPSQPLTYAQREATLKPALKQRLTQMRTAISRNRSSYTVGATEVFDQPIEQLTGLLVLENTEGIAREQALLSAKILAADQKAREEAVQRDPSLKEKLYTYDLKTNLVLRHWDWRKQGKVTAVRNQNPAGTCWVFSVIGAFESSWFIQNNQISDVSEQFIVSYGNAGSSKGGWPTLAANALTSLGTVTEVTCPYTANDTTPTPKNIFRPYRALTWGFVNPEKPSQPSISQIKEAVLKYGPVCSDIVADYDLMGYTGGVYDHKSDKAASHCIVIIGWDDDKEAWIIKNSWGWSWGENCGYGNTGGYGYIKYGCHRIGENAFWIMANSIHYTVPPQG